MIRTKYWVLGIGVAGLYVSALYPQSSPGQVEVYEPSTIKIGPVERRAIIISKNTLETGLDGLALEFVASTKARLAEMVIGVSRNGVALGTRGTVPRSESEATFADTLTQLSQSGADRLDEPVARVLKIQNNAVLSIRNGSTGKLQERVIAGTQNPRIVVLNSKSFDFLTFGVPTWPRGNRLPLVVFVKSNTTPSCGECEKLASFFADSSAATDVELQIRTDVWFPHPFFPLFFRFEPDGTSLVLGNRNRPTLAVHQRSPYMICNLALRPRAYRCDGYGRYEQVR